MKCSITVSALIAGFVLTLASSPAYAGPAGEAKEYAMPNCPIMDEPVNFSASTPTEQGPVYFCCAGCIDKYKADPAKYAKKVEAQRKVLADRPKVQVKCPLSGDPVDPKISIKHDGRELYFCCKGCAGKFEKNSDKYKTALANSYSYQTTCPVLGNPINPEALTVLPTGETIYYCCMECDKKLLSNLEEYAPKLAEQGITLDVKKLKELLKGK